MIKYDINIDNKSIDELEPNETYIGNKGTIIQTLIHYAHNNYVYVLYCSYSENLQYESMCIRNLADKFWTPVDITVKVRLKEKE